MLWYIVNQSFFVVFSRLTRIYWLNKNIFLCAFTSKADKFSRILHLLVVSQFREKLLILIINIIIIEIIIIMLKNNTIKYFVNPSRLNRGRWEKIKLNFYFHISLRCLKRFYEILKGLSKTIWGTAKKCENKNLT